MIVMQIEPSDGQQEGNDIDNQDEQKVADHELGASMQNEVSTTIYPYLCG